MSMRERTADNVHKAFVEEAKAHERLLIFASKAEEEGFPQISNLFRAVAASESIHARRHFALLKRVWEIPMKISRGPSTLRQVSPESNTGGCSFKPTRTGKRRPS